MTVALEEHPGKRKIQLGAKDRAPDTNPRLTLLDPELSTTQRLQPRIKVLKRTKVQQKRKTRMTLMK